jgi:trigger factor
MVEIVVTKSSEEPGVKTLRVEVPVELVETAEKKAASYYAKRVRLPGFRKGKVPLAVIKKKFPDAIRDNVIRDLVEESWKVALDQESLEPIAEPQVSDLKMEAGSPITFQLAVAVKPELELSRQRAPWAPVEDENPVTGDLVSITITPLEEGGSQEGKQYQVVLGDGQALPDIEEQVMRMRSGETAETSVRLPDDYPDEAKRGAARAIRIELHEVKRQQLPDLTDEFAREVGDFDSTDALKSAVRSDLEVEAGREADMEVRRLLIGHERFRRGVPDTG